MQNAIMGASVPRGPLAHPWLTQLSIRVFDVQRRQVLGNEPTTERITSGNGLASESIESEGNRKMIYLTYAMERLAEDNVGKQRVS